MNCEQTIFVSELLGRRRHRALDPHSLDSEHGATSLAHEVSLSCVICLRSLFLLARHFCERFSCELPIIHLSGAPFKEWFGWEFRWFERRPCFHVRFPCFSHVDEHAPGDSCWENCCALLCLELLLCFGSTCGCLPRCDHFGRFNFVGTLAFETDVAAVKPFAQLVCSPFNKRDCFAIAYIEHCQRCLNITADTFLFQDRAERAFQAVDGCRLFLG